MDSTTPSKITPIIEAFCRELVPNGAPFYVPVRPAPDAEPRQCYFNVATQVQKNWGKEIHGWEIWEFEGRYLEAEFHAVWQRPDGTFLDITPKAGGEVRCLFLPDPTRRFDGVPILSKRKALAESDLVHRFFELAELKDELASKQFMQQGLILAEHRLLLATQECLNHSFALMVASGELNSACPCNSGHNFARCHGNISAMKKFFGQV